MRYLFTRTNGILALNEELLLQFKGKKVIISNGFAHDSSIHNLFNGVYERTANLLGYNREECIHLFLGNSDLSIDLSNQNVALQKHGNPVQPDLNENDRFNSLTKVGLTVALYDESEPEEAFKYLLENQGRFDYQWASHFKVGNGDILVAGADKVISNGGSLVYFLLPDGTKHTTSNHTAQANRDTRYNYIPL